MEVSFASRILFVLGWSPRPSLAGVGGEVESIGWDRVPPTECRGPPDLRRSACDLDNEACDRVPIYCRARPCVRAAVKISEPDSDRKVKILMNRCARE